MVTVRSTDKEFESPEPGSYPAVCYKIIDIGTQESEYQGKKLSRRQIIIGWELSEKMANGDPFVVSSFFTASLGEKSKLRPTLESWRGAAFNEADLEGFDLSNLLGKPCMVSLIKNDKGKIKVGSVSKMPKGMVPADLVNKIVHLDLEKFHQAVFDTLSDKVKDMVRRSPEYQALLNPSAKDAGQAEVVEDVPF